jgi:hypothetical protein
VTFAPSDPDRVAGRGGNGYGSPAGPPYAPTAARPATAPLARPEPGRPIRGYDDGDDLDVPDFLK